MKNLILNAIILQLLAITSAMAQNPVTALQHNGVTQVFYGQSSFSDALNASIDGDTLYLSAGFFAAPTSIDKGVTVIGSGHFPDSANVSKRTTILSGFQIIKGADSLHLEGLYINKGIDYDGSNSINYVSINRCRLVYVHYNSNSTSAGKNFCSIEECFVTGDISFSSYGTNLHISRCIFSRVGLNLINSINGGALIDRNIFIYQNDDSYWALFWSVRNSVIENNIFIIRGLAGRLFGNTSSGNYINNNLLTLSAFEPDAGSSSSNYFNVAQSDIFIDQTGQLIDYSHDYHLKNPETYLGTDGTQVGIYGGSKPFKAKGYPSNPQVIKKNVAAETDTEGKLKINFTVKAQTY